MSIMVSLLSIALLLAVLCSFSSCSANSYRKELRANKEVNQETFIQLGRSTQSTRVDPSQVIELSQRPRAFLYRGFLSDEECEHLISLAHGKLEKTLVKEHYSGLAVMSNLLSNASISLDMGQDDIVARIEDRISAWTFLPKEYSEPLQVLHYSLEDAKQHYDYHGSKAGLVADEPVMATVILYLSNVTRGGGIFFPKSEFKNTHPEDDTWSDCAKTSYAVRPIKGNALLFFSLHPNTTPDESSSHARCPVLKGEKWCATKFFHTKAIDQRKISLESDSNDCTDEEESCPRWAALGECQRNALYMIGSPDYYGSCRKSCNAC